MLRYNELNYTKTFFALRFYMPHGLTVDSHGKVWITDVGLHQVLKFDLKSMDEPELVLGY